MDTIDALLTRAKRATSALLAVEVRELDPTQLTAAELALEVAWAEALRYLLEDLYWYPLRNGLDSVPVEDVRPWLEQQYEDNPEVAALLLLLLLDFLRRGANVGGAVGLELLGVGGAFSLTNAEYLAMLSAHANALTTVGADLSLIDTTIDDLVRFIEAERENGGGVLWLNERIGERAEYRAGLIAETELAWTVALALMWTYARNDVALMMYQIRDEGACNICRPWDGKVVEVDNPPVRIPQHPSCRCWWLPVLMGWEAPGMIWRGG